MPNDQRLPVVLERWITLKLQESIDHDWVLSDLRTSERSSWANACQRLMSAPVHEIDECMVESFAAGIRVVKVRVTIEEVS